MGHVPLSGPGGTLEALARLERPRVILVHINNTNPVLLEDSPERDAVLRAGVEVGYDGLEVEAAKQQGDQRADRGEGRQQREQQDGWEDDEEDDPGHGEQEHGQQCHSEAGDEVDHLFEHLSGWEVFDSYRYDDLPTRDVTGRPTVTSGASIPSQRK